MHKLPRITGEELVRCYMTVRDLKKEGFEVVRQRGSHVQVRKYIDGEKVTFSVPVHKGKVLKPGTLRGTLNGRGRGILCH